MRLVVYLVFLICFPVQAIAKADLVVGVSILPQKYFVERIAGSDVDVIVMVGEGYNPLTYEPKPKQLTHLSRASLYFLAGVPFERKWVQLFRDVNPSMKVVPLSREIKLRNFDASNNHNHGAVDHGVLDPHYWLNPLLVINVAATIRDALSVNNPERQKNYHENYLSFVKDLENLSLRIQQKLANTKLKEFLVFHPSWGYFADAYGLSQVAVEVQGRQAGAKTLNTLITKVKSMGAKVIFVQKQFSDRDARMIAKETGVRLVHIDPLAEDYMENMDMASRKFMEALQ